jgi:hypothetical protein
VCVCHLQQLQGKLQGAPCVADLLLSLMCRVNVQLGGSAPAVHVDADGSWKHQSSGEGGHTEASSGSGAELRGWHVRVVQGLTIAAIAMCIWALVESILSTHGSAQKFWDIIDNAAQQVSSMVTHWHNGVLAAVCSATWRILPSDSDGVPCLADRCLWQTPWALISHVVRRSWIQYWRRAKRCCRQRRTPAAPSWCSGGAQQQVSTCLQMCCSTLLPPRSMLTSTPSVVCGVVHPSG